MQPSSGAYKAAEARGGEIWKEAVTLTVGSTIPPLSGHFVLLGYRYCQGIVPVGGLFAGVCQQSHSLSPAKSLIPGYHSSYYPIPYSFALATIGQWTKMTRLDDERGKFSSPHKSFLPYQFPRSDVAILSRSFSSFLSFLSFSSNQSNTVRTGWNSFRGKWLRGRLAWTGRTRRTSFES